MTNLLLDKMIKGSTSTVPGRIINISCGRNKKRIYFPDLNFMNKDYSWKDAYSQSKSAVLLFTQELAKRTKGDIKCFFLHSEHFFCHMVSHGFLPILDILPSLKQRLREKTYQWRNQRNFALFLGTFTLPDTEKDR